MNSTYLKTKNFWAGSLYVMIGGVAAWVAQGYGIGKASAMGAGFFPAVLGLLLCLTGVIVLIRSATKAARAKLDADDLVGQFSFRSTLLVLGAALLFAASLEPLGFLIAFPVAMVIAAMASDRFHFGLVPMALLGCLTLACTAVFIWGLGLPLDLIGPALGG